MKKYALKLLFQFLIRSDNNINRRRLCEQRIIIIEAKNPSSALKKGKVYAKKCEHDYIGANGGHVFFSLLVY
jgi:hypothetical protein